MRLSSLLQPEHIVLGVEARSLEGAVREILDRVERFRPERPKAEVLEAVLRREAQAGTALEKGIALPHARVSGLRDFHFMVGVAKEPLDDVCADGTPVELLFLILADDSKNTVMLQTMAAVGKLAEDAARLDALKRARTADEVWNLIEESGVRAKRGLFARDLMRPAPVVAHAGMPLRELLDALFEHSVHQAPVCEEDGSIIGAVTSEEIIEAGFPDYMARIPNLGFLTEFEPFEQFFQREATTHVKDIMNQRPLVVEADDPMIQVVFRLRKERRRFAYVQDQGKFAGVIDRDDILSRVLRA